MGQYQYKDIPSKAVDVDQKGRKVKVILSEMGSADLDNDIIDSGAYTKTLADRGPKGADLIWHLTDHNASLKSAVGKFSDLYVEGNKLIGITPIVNTSWGNDVLEMYNSGMVNQHSIGFSTVKAEVSDNDKDPRIIKELKLYEGSAVLWGANPNTPTLDAGMKKMFKDAIDPVIAELEWVMKAVRIGKLSDERHELFEIRIKQLIEAITSQDSTEAVVPTLQPDARKKQRQILLASLLLTTN